MLKAMKKHKRTNRNRNIQEGGVTISNGTVEGDVVGRDKISYEDPSIVNKRRSEISKEIANTEMKISEIQKKLHEAEYYLVFLEFRILETLFPKNIKENFLRSIARFVTGAILICFFFLFIVVTLTNPILFPIVAFIWTASVISLRRKKHVYQKELDSLAVHLSRLKTELEMLNSRLS